MGKLVAGAAFFVLPAALIAACAGKTTSTNESAPVDAAISDRPRLPAPIVVDAACRIIIDTPPLLASPHVPVGTAITYSSNPPSSGPHYPIWAAYKTFNTPVDRRYYVHNLEHGGIVFAYRCGSPSGCPEAAEALAAFERAMAAIPDDPRCTGSSKVRTRTLVTPDPLLDVPIAVVAWGWTYKAECIDEPSLRDFALAHYGQGTESTCANGQEQF